MLEVFKEVFTQEFFVSTSAQEAVGALLTLALFFIGQKLWKERKFGGWTVEVNDINGQHVMSRPVGTKKTEEILDDLSTLSVFLKGLVSPFGWLKIDLVTKGVELGALKIDNTKKQFVIDLSIEGVLSKPAPQPKPFTKTDFVSFVNAGVEAGLIAEEWAGLLPK